MKNIFMTDIFTKDGVLAKDLIRDSLCYQKIINILFVVLFLINPALLFADSGSATGVPIGKYIAELPSETSSNLPSTGLTGFYPPILGSLSFKAGASKSIAENTSSGEGGVSSSFSLAVDNDSGETVYLNLQGVNNTGAWGTACSFNPNTIPGVGVDYVQACVGTGGISMPAGIPVNLYLAKQIFIDSNSFQSAMHFSS